MKMNKKLLSMTALTAALAGGFASTAQAQTAVDANATFLAALALTKVNDMEFGTVELSGAIAGGDTATMNTDGSITYGGQFSGSGTGTAGEVDITAGTDGQVVEVLCTSTATLSDGSSSSIDLTSIAFDVETGTNAVGTNSCTDISTVAGTLTLAVGGGSPNDTILLSGVLDGGTNTSFVETAHSTSTGGTPIQVDVQYQ